MNLKKVKEQMSTLFEQMETETRSEQFDVEKFTELKAQYEQMKATAEALEGFEAMKEDKGEVRMMNTNTDANVMEEVRSMLTTGEGAKVIPTTLADKVIAVLAEKYSFWSEIPTISGEGKIEVLKEGDPVDAEFYAELDAINFDDESFEKVELGLKRVATGVQLTKSFIYNAKLDESYFVERLAQRIASKIAHNLVLGDGSATSFEGLAKLDNEIETEDADLLTFNDIVNAVSNLHPSVLSGAKIVVNRQTFAKMAQWKDNAGGLLMLREKNQQNEFVYKLVGLEVVINDAVEDIGADMRPVYIVNPSLWNKRIEQDITVEKVSDLDGAKKGVYSYICDLYADCMIVDPQQAIAIKVKA